MMLRDLRELNTVLLGNFEDNFRISEFTALVDDQASQLTGLHAEMSATKPHHDFSRALTEKSDLAKNGFLLLDLLPCLLSLELFLEFPDGLALNMHAFGIVCIISDDILIGVCVFRHNAGSLNRAAKRDDLEIIGGELPEAVVHHVVADRIAVVLLLLNRLTQNKIELFNDLDNTVGFKLILVVAPRFSSTSIFPELPGRISPSAFLPLVLERRVKWQKSFRANQKSV